MNIYHVDILSDLSSILLNRTKFWKIINILQKKKQKGKTQKYFERKKRKRTKDVNKIQKLFATKTLHNLYMHSYINELVCDLVQ